MLTRRAFLKMALAQGVAGMAALPLSYGYATQIEPTWLALDSLELRLPRLSPAFEGYRLVHISDLHADESLEMAHLAEVVGRINALQPDLVAITGDFISLQLWPIFDPYVATLRQLEASDGVVAVLGNHDHWHDPDGVRRLLAQSGIQDLSNRQYSLTRGSDQLHLCGVDDVWEGLDRLELVLADLPDDGAAILLAHEPDFADTSAASGRFDLQLSGHSHGGQVRLPWIGAPILPPLAQRYPIGLYQVGTMWQYTTRGIGMVSPKVRFGCRPEITLLTLRAGGR
jgi:hypothetical protein